MGEITLKFEAIKKHKAINVVSVTLQTSGDVRKYLTLVYAFSGCDTKSAVYRQMPTLKPLEKIETLKGGG